MQAEGPPALVHGAALVGVMLEGVSATETYLRLSEHAASVSELAAAKMRTVGSFTCTFNAGVPLNETLLFSCEVDDTKQTATAAILNPANAGASIGIGNDRISPMCEVRAVSVSQASSTPCAHL